MRCASLWCVARCIGNQGQQLSPVVFWSPCYTMWKFTHERLKSTIQYNALPCQVTSGSHPDSEQVACPIRWEDSRATTIWPSRLKSAGNCTIATRKVLRLSSRRGKVIRHWAGRLPNCRRSLYGRCAVRGAAHLPSSPLISARVFRLRDNASCVAPCHQERAFLTRDRDSRGFSNNWAASDL